MHEPLISIVVPVYNVENYLQKCIQSIRDQTYENLQIIIVDDGSTDASGFLCDQYAAEDSRICVFHTENQGLSDARNEGMKHVKGDYVAFVDSDDHVGLDHIRNFINALREYPTADLIITGPTKYFDGQDTPVRTQEVKVKEISKEDAIKTAISIYDQTFSVNAWGKLYGARLYRQLVFPSGRLFEDNYVYYKAFCEAECILYEDARDYFYLTDRVTSITNTKTKNNFDELNAYVEMLPYVKDHAPLAYNAVYGNYAGRIIASYDLAHRLGEQQRADELYQSILENRKAVRSNPGIPSSTRLAYTLTFLGRGMFDLAVNIHQRLLKMKQETLKHKALDHDSQREVEQ